MAPTQQVRDGRGPRNSRRDGVALQRRTRPRGRLGQLLPAKNAFVAATYDGVIAFALAMQMSKSTNPSVYVQYITR